jgi:xanthine dehydrogenase accessory factor
MKREVLDAVVRARGEKRAVVLFTQLDGPSATLWSPGDAPLDAQRSEAATRALATDDAFVFLPGGPDGPKYFVEAFNPPLRLVLVGAVHIAEALAAVASVAGYEVIIVDPREAFARREPFEGYRVITEWPDEVLEGLGVDHRTAIVTLTHDPKIDDPALEAALRSPAFYIGALGSGKTHASRARRLSEKGFGPDDLGRIHGPVGLRIGARTPAEIAVSVFAELTQQLRLGARPGAA